MYNISDENQKKSVEKLLDGALELNKRIIDLENGKNYRNSILATHFLKYLKQLNIKHIISRLRVRKNIKRLPKDFKYKDEPFFPERNYFSQEKIVVYSVLFGAYDEIKEPIFVPDNCDFYLITDQELSPKSAWKRVDVSEFDLSDLTNVEKNRYFKMLPHLLFPNQKFSIYIDSNILVVGDLTAMINCIKESGIAMHAHRHRNCLYSEAKAAEMVNKISRNQFHEYKKHLDLIGMPLNYGLPECNIIAREHNNPRCISLMNRWWDLFKNSNIKRDQLHISIAMWQESIIAEEIETLGSDVYLNPLIRVINHK